MTPHSRMEYLFFARTDCGRVRKNNEDAVATAPEIGLALLADGMGGYNAGEVASNMAISITEHAMARWFAQGDLRRVLGLWVNGLDVDWRQMPRRRQSSRRSARRAGG